MVYTRKMKCKICKSLTKKVFRTKVLGKYSINYFSCPQCSFIQTEEPFWLNEAYDSPMNVCDTGILIRNTEFSRISTVLFSVLFKKNSNFLDYSGGYGVFTRMMRDIGFNYYWQDPFTSNLLARGFELPDEVEIEAVTAFEVFEHFVNPLYEVEKIMEISETILFSTELIPIKIPKKDWWYYGFEHGQHVSLYSNESLRILAKQLDLYYCSNNSRLHLFSRKKISNVYYNLLLKASKVLFPFIRTRLKSKTYTDHLTLIKSSELPQ